MENYTVQGTAAKQKAFPLKKIQNISIPFQQFFFLLFPYNKEVFIMSVNREGMCPHIPVRSVTSKTSHNQNLGDALIGGNDWVLAWGEEHFGQAFSVLL